MSERYPSDSDLLAMTADAATGVEYIPTGRSPYYLEFRRLVQRLILAAERANDLRVYADGELSIGVRGGRCVIGAAAIAFAGAEGVPVDDDATTAVWIDATGTIVTSDLGMPSDRTAFIPLAEVTCEAGAIVSITDLRGEAFLLTPNLPTLGLTATADEINRALDGAAESVDAAALSVLTAGPASTADTEHRHEQMFTDADAETAFRLVNDSAGSSANVMLRFDLPQKLAGVTDLMPDTDTGFLVQRYLGEAHPLVGSVHVQLVRPGDLTATAAGLLIGAAPVTGSIVDVILTAGANIESSVGGDGVRADVTANGVAVTTTSPALTASDGAGFRSTDQGDGTAAAVATGGAERIARGDVLRVDLVRSAGGTVGVEAADLAVIVVIRPDGPR